MIKQWFVTGDTHSQNLLRITQLKNFFPSNPEESALIILGDAGFNFYLNRTDEINKRRVNNTGYTVYCVRGNHEERPENLGMNITYDKNVQGEVFFEKKFPNIKYFIDGHEYFINGLKTLVIGGAYSVDKYYRIEGAKPGEWTGWFQDEQLSKIEMEEIENNVSEKKYDMILSHTCPYSWRPTDLFISNIDSSTIDNSMELWLNGLKNKISYNIWLFGHFHDDRIVRPGVEMFFTEIENLNSIINRWSSPRKKIDKMKDPKYYYKD